MVVACLCQIVGGICIHAYVYDNVRSEFPIV